MKRTTRDPNEIIINGDIAEVVLRDIKQREVARAIIDIKDVEKIRCYKWHALKRKHGICMATTINGNPECMPNIIMGFKSNNKHQIDHKDRNPLNNRKINLRICTHSQNQMNKNKGKNNTSGYKGVYWHKRNKKWAAHIRFNNKKYHIGYFNKKTEAAMAYNKAAVKHHGEYACLNERIL